MSIAQAKKSKDELAKLIDELNQVLSVSSTGSVTFMGIPVFLAGEQVEVDIDPDSPVAQQWGPKTDVWSLADNADDTQIPDANKAQINPFMEVMSIVRGSITNIVQTVALGHPPGTDEYSFYKNIIGPLVETLLEDILVAKENPFWNNFDGTGSIANYFDPVPKQDLFDKLDGLLIAGGAASVFLDTLGIQVNLLGDIRSVPNTAEAGTAIIKSDAELEASLLGRGITVGDYYIGMILKKTFSQLQEAKGQTDKDFIPVRYSPQKGSSPLPRGWDDPDFQLINSKAEPIAVSGLYTDYSSGVEFPLGMTVFVTEIVSSATGIWVGFVPVFSGQGTESGEDSEIGKLVNKVTNNYQKILYTRPEYLRKREASVNSLPDPLIKLNLTTNITSYGANNLTKGPASKTSDKFSKVLADDKITYTWTNEMKPMDVRLGYFNFNKYNELESEKVFNKKIKLTPQGYIAGRFKKTHKFSEGYYYFIVGEGQSEGIGLATSLEVPPAILNKTFNDLLRYLGKDPFSNTTVPVNLLQMLRDEYFAPVSTRMQTSGLNTGKQQVLFAIPASYVDSLPMSTKPYFNTFSTNSEFYSGNNFVFNFTTKNNGFKKQVDNLIEVFEKFKSQIQTFEDAGNKITDPYDLEYKVEEQIKAFKGLRTKFEGFLQRQWSPYTTEQDRLNELISKSFSDSDEFDHIIQVGLRDNGKVGEDVRLTVSHVLFSPDPNSLRDLEDDQLDLFDFDPYFPDRPTESFLRENRSAVILRKGLSYLRNEIADIAVSESEADESSGDSPPSILKTSSVIGTRTLHYLMNARHLVKYEETPSSPTSMTEDINDPWIEMLMTHSVPPLRVYISKKKSSSPEMISCQELLKQINEMSTDLTTADRKILEQFYSRPECQASYFDQFKKPTPAVGPQSSRESIEERQKELEESSSVAFEKLMILYRGFLNNLDPQSILSLLMSCLQSKFGMPLTAEAICEAVIVKIIESDPMGFKQALIDYNPTLAMALGINPADGLRDRIDNNLDKILGEERSEGVPDPITGEVQFSSQDGLNLDETYDGAPFATAALLFGVVDPYAINVIKNLEKGGVAIELNPGVIRPPVYDAQGNLERYNLRSIQEERQRLKELGYSVAEANAIMVQNGFLVPKKEQYDSLINSTFDALGDIGDAFNYSNNAAVYATAETSNATKAFAEDAKAWVAYAKRVVDLGQICEAIIGPLLNMPRDLLRGEGFNSSYYENYWENLQKMFRFPTPKLDLSDNLNTNNFMGDYGDMLLDTFLGTVGTMLGQILNSVLTHYLNTCFEQDDEQDRGSSLGRNNPSQLIPDIGKLAGFRGGQSVGPAEVRSNDLLKWLTEIVETLSTDQLCALLKTQASTNLLNQCVEFTITNHNGIYRAGIDSGAVIQSIFTRISEDIDIDICDTIQGARIIASQGLCQKSDYNSAARITQLVDTGMSDEQARRQFARELEDLSGTIKDIADLLYPTGNPIANKLPEICGPQGAFSLPAGIKDTMNRVTDNILMNVEGTLLRDLSTLKFFSLPSRALMAISDPNEMALAQTEFLEATRDPYKVECFAFVGPNFINTSTDTENRYRNTNYCLTYNEFIHYNSAQFKAPENALLENPVQKLIFHSMDDVSAPRVPILGVADPISNAPELAGYGASLTYVSLARKIINMQLPWPDEVGNSNIGHFIRNGGKNLFGREQMLPVLMTEFFNELPEGTKYWSSKSSNPLAGELLSPIDLSDLLDNSDLPFENSRVLTENSIEFFNTYKNRYDSLAPFIENYIESLSKNSEYTTISNTETKENIDKVIYEQFEKSIKPPGLDNIVYSVDMLLDEKSYDSAPRRRRNDGQYSGQINNLKTGGSFGLSTSPGHSNYHKPDKKAEFAAFMENHQETKQTAVDFTNKNRKFIWKKKYKLTDRLIDINPNPNYWNGMLQYYTGAKIFWQTIYDPNSDDKHDINDKDYVWRATSPGVVKLTESPHYIGDGSAYPHTVQVGSHFGIDPDRVETAENLIDQWEDEDYSDEEIDRKLAQAGLSDYDQEVTMARTTTLYIGNLAWAFMHMTLAEASGLTQERIKAIYPNLEQNLSIEHVLLGTSFSSACLNTGRLVDNSDIGHIDSATSISAIEDIGTQLSIGGVNLLQQTLDYNDHLQELEQEKHILFQQLRDIPSYEHEAKDKKRRELDDKKSEIRAHEDAQFSISEDIIDFYTPPRSDYDSDESYQDDRDKVRKQLNKRLKSVKKQIDAMIEILESPGVIDYESLQNILNSALEELHVPIFEDYYPPFKNSDFDGFRTNTHAKIRLHVNSHPQIIPLAVTFFKYFRKPDMFDDPGSWEMGENLVNKKFYETLGDNDLFPQYLGFTPDGNFKKEDPTNNTSNYQRDSEYEPRVPSFYNNFNPNTLRYPLPIDNKIVYGVNQSELNKQIGEIFSDLTVLGDEGQIQGISDSISTFDSNKEIWYQNGAASVIYNSFKDDYHFAKAKFISNDPPRMFNSIDSRFHNHVADIDYNFSFIKNIDSDVEGLLKELYPTAAENNSINDIMHSVIDEEFNKVQDVIINSPDTEGLLAQAPSDQQTKALQEERFRGLETMNYKAKVFGRLLRNKFEKYYKEYGGHQGVLGATNTAQVAQASAVLNALGLGVETEQKYVPPSTEQVAEFMSSIEFNMATYGYSALQFAYTNQMFARLRTSRLNKRKFLRKLWDKILKTPQARGETSKADEACQQIFNNLGITSSKDLKEADTDFFNIGAIKSHIMEYYEKSICRDVYESSPEGENSVKNSLLQGIVLLIIKIYSLEMCIASVIAWDVMDMQDIFSDELMTKVILQNIINDFGDISFISRHAREIVTNQTKLNYKDNWSRLVESSPLDILIKNESREISSIIDDMFINGERITTKLNITKLSNADEDFVDRYRSRYESVNDEDITLEAEILRSFYLNFGYEIIVDAKLNNNIYSFNHGHPFKNSNFSFKNINTVTDINQNFGINDDIVGSSLRRDMKRNRQKDYFHSLPTRQFYDKALGDLSTTDYNSLSEGSAKDGTYVIKADQFINSENWANYDEGKNEGEPARDVVFSDMFKGLLPYDKENIHELTVSNNLNAQIGNIIFQTYVKVIEQDDLNQFRFVEYVDPNTGQVCDVSIGTPVEYNPEEHLPILINYREGLADGTVVKPEVDASGNYIKDAQNIYGANPWHTHLYGYVPLNIWTDFYHNKFLKEIENNEILKKYFDRFGLKPFFKNLEIGIRMTYACSHVVESPSAVNDEGIKNFASFMGKHMNRRGLNECKTLISQRLRRREVYDYTTNKSKIYIGEDAAGTPSNEIHIPIVEVSRKLIFDRKGFRYNTDSDESPIRPYSQLGFYSKFDKNNVVADYKILGLDTVLREMSTDFDKKDSINGLIAHFSNNFSQLFYRDLASDLLIELQNSAEFKLVFEHLLPLRRYMTLSFLYAGDSLSRFITDNTKILEQSKSALRQIFEALINSDRFEYQPDPLGPGGHPALAGDMGDTRGQDPDLEKEILKIILRTPMLILKGFVEVTDMAIIIAKSIIDIANTIQKATIAAVEQALRAVKQGIQTAIDEAKSSMTEIEVNASSVSAALSATKTGLTPAWKSAVAPEGWSDEDIEDAITLDASADEITEWKFEVNMSKVPQTLKDDESFLDFKEQMDSAADLIEAYKEAKDSVSELEEQMLEITKEIDEKVTKAKQVLKDIFSSPWLLPSLWAALVPSQLPFLGGLVPIPFFVGPPSTIPGMIYLALLFIDGYEEKQHELSQSIENQDGVNCEDEL